VGIADLLPIVLSDSDEGTLIRRRLASFIVGVVGARTRPGRTPV